MILLVEIGNARLKWATLNQGHFNFAEAIAHYESGWEKVLEIAWEKLPVPQKVIVANVAGKKMAAFLTSWIKAHWKCEFTFLEALPSACGVINAYEVPQKLGIDRWVAMLAARKKTKGAFCVVSCGTCITVDAVNEQGMHQGGWITPGVVLLQQSVIQRTEGCAAAHVNIKPEALTLGKNTEECLSHGSLLMTVAWVDRAMHQVKQRLGDSFTCFLTGGDAKLLSPLLSVKHQHEENLVLQGMVLINNR